MDAIGDYRIAPGAFRRRGAVASYLRLHARVGREVGLDQDDALGVALKPVSGSEMCVRREDLRAPSGEPGDHC